jgi:Cu(I)/Ag(I) efflux system periplasmic protein CusF
MKRMVSLIAILAAATTTLAQAADASGQVTKIDKANARVTLKHGEIKSLDMPPMTMVYRVRDPKALDAVAVGDKVRFTAEKIDGSYVVTSISRAP